MPVCKTVVVATAKQGECRCPSDGKAKSCSLPCCACAKDMPHVVHGRCDGHDVLVDRELLVEVASLEHHHVESH